MLISREETRLDTIYEPNNDGYTKYMQQLVADGWQVSGVHNTNTKIIVKSFKLRTIEGDKHSVILD